MPEYDGWCGEPAVHRSWCCPGQGSQNFLFAGILERVQDLFRNNGEEIYVAYLDEEADEVQYAVQLVKLRRPKGIIFLGGDLDCFRREFHPITVPCVFIL